jgi:hypothetical protein
MFGTATASLFTREPTPIPPNDRCEGAIELTSGARRHDTTIGFGDDATGGSCAAWGTFLDAFYTFTLTERSTVLFTVSDEDDSGSNFYLTLRNGCAGGELACVSGVPSATITETLEPGTYYLMVETYDWDPTDFQAFFFTFPE